MALELPTSRFGSPIALDDGTALRVRRIRADDKEPLNAALERLSAKSTHARFLAAKPRFGSGELAYLTEVDHVNHHAIVVVPPGDDSEIVAVGRYVRLARDPQTVEIAIAVADDHQGRGLGRGLAVRLAEHARRHGVRRVEAYTHGDNRAAQRLIEIITETIETESVGSGVRHLVGDLAA